MPSTYFLCQMCGRQAVPCNEGTYLSSKKGNRLSLLLGLFMGGRLDDKVARDLSEVRSRASKRICTEHVIQAALVLSQMELIASDSKIDQGEEALTKFVSAEQQYISWSPAARIAFEKEARKLEFDDLDQNSVNVFIYDAKRIGRRDFRIETVHSQTINTSTTRELRKLASSQAIKGEAVDAQEQGGVSCSRRFVVRKNIKKEVEDPDFSQASLFSEKMKKEVEDSELPQVSEPADDKPCGSCRCCMIHERERTTIKKFVPAPPRKRKKSKFAFTPKENSS